MELTPSQISGASFRTVRKGYDPDEVEAFLRDAAGALEQAQQQATAMEARARAAVARLQEQQSAATDADTATGDTALTPAAESAVRDIRIGADEAEAISRTLLLAQRTADTTVAEAEEEADRIRTAARLEADSTLDSTRELSSRLVDEARSDARKASEDERVAAANEVEALKARRDFLLGDVDQLESFMIDQRERLRGAARQIEAMCDRVPSGLGHVSAPAVSASGDEPADGDGDGDDVPEVVLPPEARGPFASADELAEALGDTQLSDELSDGDAEAHATDSRDVDTGELDVTRALDAVDAPRLPIRGLDDDETDGATADETDASD